MNDFATCLNNGGHIDALLLDLAKAFDKVPHQHLCYKLSHYGINGDLLIWIKDFLNKISNSYTRGGTQHIMQGALGWATGNCFGTLVIFYLYQ